MYTQPQEQIPILCKACGGPSTPVGPTKLRCPYCGTEDQLPESEVDRAMELRRRVAVAASKVAQLGGLAKALGSIYEDPKALLRVALPYGVLLLIAGMTALTSVAQTQAPQHRGLGLVFVVQALLPVLAFVVGPVIALMVGRHRFRTRVRPLLRARAPLSPGAPARCRACGGTLPDERGPYIRCRYCTTTSLVTEELARDRERLLREEALAYQSQTQQVSASAVQIGQDMNRLFTIAMVGGVVLTWVAGAAMGWVIEWMLGQ